MLTSSVFPDVYMPMVKYKNALKHIKYETAGDRLFSRFVDFATLIGHSPL